MLIPVWEVEMEMVPPVPLKLSVGKTWPSGVWPWADTTCCTTPEDAQVMVLLVPASGKPPQSTIFQYTLFPR